MIQATPKAGKLIADISSICYGHEEAKNPEKLLGNLYKLGHHSTFEHIYYTFKIEGISRTCLGQLTRHRHASYTVRSQRYCDESDFKVITPDPIWDSSERDKFFKTVESISLMYDELIEAGIKREDARFILPQALATDLYMSCNLRELMHINKLRTAKNAQWEIRDLVNEMTMLVVENSPELSFIFEEGK